MQIAVVEFARYVLGLKDANSTEFAPATPHPAVVFMPEGSKTQMGGTMRLGARRTLIAQDCTSSRLYQRSEKYIDERHRHRYEVNPEMVPMLEEKGLKFVGRDETGERMEILELLDNPSDHPFFVAAQFHPEFKSRPGKPSPLFLGFILASGRKLSAYLRPGFARNSSGAALVEEGVASINIAGRSPMTPHRNLSLEAAAEAEARALQSGGSPTRHH